MSLNTPSAFGKNKSKVLFTQPRRGHRAGFRHCSRILGREEGREFERQMLWCAGISEETSVSYRQALSTVMVGGQWGLGL